MNELIVSIILAIIPTALVIYTFYTLVNIREPSVWEKRLDKTAEEFREISEKISKKVSLKETARDLKKKERAEASYQKIIQKQLKVFYKQVNRAASNGRFACMTECKTLSNENSYSPISPSYRVSNEAGF